MPGNKSLSVNVAGKQSAGKNHKEAWDIFEGDEFTYILDCTDDCLVHSCQDVIKFMHINL